MKNFKPHQLRSHDSQSHLTYYRSIEQFKTEVCQRMLRCLTIRCVVARHTDNGKSTVQLGLSAFPRIVGTRYAWMRPLQLRLLPESGRIGSDRLREPAGEKTRSLTHLILGATMARFEVRAVQVSPAFRSLEPAFYRGNAAFRFLAGFILFIVKPSSVYSR